MVSPYPKAVTDVARGGKFHYSGQMDDTPHMPAPEAEKPRPAPEAAEEVGGSKKPEPTRYGDWEIGGRCIDF